MEFECNENIMWNEHQQQQQQLQQYAIADPTLLNDNRVIEHLLLSEDRYLPSHPPFKFQKDVEPYMLKMVLSWMLEVTEEEKCEEDVFPLASNYMCRILGVMQLPKRQLQLLGAVCLFIASKIKECQPLSAEKLVVYTDYSVKLGEMMEMEMVVLFRLKWDLSAVTPNDFLPQILHRLQITNCGQIKRYVQTYISLCSTEFKFASMAPSIVCAACIGTAIKQLDNIKNSSRNNNNNNNNNNENDKDEKIFQKLQEITRCESDCLRHHQEQVESEIVRFLCRNQQESCSKEQQQQDVNDNGSLTPTDVLDIVY